MERRYILDLYVLLKITEMKKIIDFIVSIPHDKLLHILAGIVIGGVFDKKDMYATISGGLIFALLTVY